MNFLKITLSVIAVFLISIAVPTLRTPANATENKPLDVHLTIETKEIDISEIPDDRIVYLGISVENAPPFKGLTMYLDKDPRLKFGELKPFKPAEGAQNIGSINVISYLEKEPDILGCGVPAKGTKMIDHSGVLIMTELVLPEDVRAGDFYYVKFSPYLVDSYMVIDLSIFPEDRYGLDSFTELNNGGIRITKKAPPASTASSSATTSSTISSAPASTASSSAAVSSTISSAPASTASSSTTASSTISSTPVSTASSSTAGSSTTSSVPASTASSSTTASSTISSTPASTASTSTAAASSMTSSAPASTASSSTAATSSTTSSAPASTASALTAADSSVSSTSSSVPEATSDNKEDPESKNGFPIIAGLIALGVIALSLTAVFLVRAKRKK